MWAIQLFAVCFWAAILLAASYLTFESSLSDWQKTALFGLWTVLLGLAFGDGRALFLVAFGGVIEIAAINQWWQAKKQLSLGKGHISPQRTEPAPSQG